MMTVFGSIFIWYVIFGVIFGIFVYLSGVIKDVVDGPDPQFGYNYNCPMFISFSVGCALPFVNLVIIYAALKHLYYCLS